MIDILTAALAETLCRADDTMFHHERTDDFPCSFCKGYAAEQAETVHAWLAGLAQEPETVERVVSAFVEDGLIPEDMSYAEIASAALAAFVDGIGQ